MLLYIILAKQRFIVIQYSCVDDSSIKLETVCKQNYSPKKVFCKFLQNYTQTLKHEWVFEGENLWLEHLQRRILIIMWPPLPPFKKKKKEPWPPPPSKWRVRYVLGLVSGTIMEENFWHGNQKLSSISKGNISDHNFQWNLFSTLLMKSFYS